MEETTTKPENYEYTVWLVKTDDGYVHCGFTSLAAALAFCRLHLGYRFIERPVYKYQPE